MLLQEERAGVNIKESRAEVDRSPERVSQAIATADRSCRFFNLLRRSVLPPRSLLGSVAHENGSVYVPSTAAGLKTLQLHRLDETIQRALCASARTAFSRPTSAACRARMT